MTRLKEQTDKFDENNIEEVLKEINILLCQGEGKAVKNKPLPDSKDEWLFKHYEKQTQMLIDEKAKLEKEIVNQKEMITGALRLNTI